MSEDHNRAIKPKTPEEGAARITVNKKFRDAWLTTHAPDATGQFPSATKSV